MTASAADWAEFAPPEPPAQLRALGLAILAHVLLLGALGWGVSWRHQAEQQTVEAELWSAVPQQAAPRLQTPPPPPPPPQPQPQPQPRPASPPPPPPDTAQRDADIALERQKKEAEAQAARLKAEQEQKRRQKLEAEKQEVLQREREQKRLAAEKAEQERQKKTAEARAAQEKEAARAEKELKAQREANLRRMAGLAGATGSDTAIGTAQRSSGPSASYAGKVAARVKPNIVFTDDIAGNPMADVEVRAAPDGTIVGARLLKSSGVKAWDDAVLKAIVKTEKLPLDTDGRAPSTLVIGFRPKD